MIKELREEIAAEVSREHTFAGDDAKKLAAWDPFDPNAFAPFFDGEWMFGLDASANEGWFDIAFANPPYIRQEKIESFRINGLPVIAKAQLKADYKTFSGTADIYVYFYERALRLLKPSGALAFITSNKWYRAGYGKGLREWLSIHARILKIIDFGDAPVFEAIAYPTILVGTRKAVPGKPGPNETVQSLNWTTVEGEDPKESVKRFPEHFVADAFAMPQAELSSSGWQLEPQAERDLLARLRAGGTPLGEWCQGRFYRGILTGLNEAFVIDGAKRAELIAADPGSAEIIKPFLRGRDVKRWQMQPADKWLIKIASSENEEHPWSGLPDDKAEAVFRKTHGAIYDWWIKEDLRDRLIARTDQGRYFWELRSCTYYDAFEGSKLIYPDIYEHQSFALDTEGFFAGNTAYFIPTNAEWLSATMNSSSTEWFYRQVSNSIQGGYLRAFTDIMKQVPVPKPGTEEQEALAILARAVRAGADRPRPEALVNAFVYELFFAEELQARNLRPFAAAREAGLMNLAKLEGPPLARAADEWSRYLADPTHPLYATLFDLQSIDAVRIIEGRT